MKKEHEYHFVINCTLYTDVRKAYLKLCYYVRPNMLKFIDLLTYQNSYIVKKLAMFIFKAWGSF